MPYLSQPAQNHVRAAVATQAAAVALLVGGSVTDPAIWLPNR